MTKISRPVLRYHGGKFRLAPWIISHFPAHRTYVEPFGGAASVLMLKPRSYAEIYNDRWSTVVNVFRVLRDPDKAAALERALRLTPFARVEFEQAQITPDDTDVEAARKTILRSFAGFGSASTNGKYSTGFRANSQRSNTTAAHDWTNYPGHIAAFTERLRGVVIECRDAFEVIEQHDRDDALHYVDPPYPHETRNMRRGNASYAHEFTTEKHERLAEHLHRVRGTVIVSSYPSRLYQRLYSGWAVRQSRARADGARPRLEVLYLNLACARTERQAHLPIEEITT